LKRQVMLAALALLVTSGAASAFTKEQQAATNVVCLAYFAGNQKNNRCPRFQLIDGAAGKELRDGGVITNEIFEQTLHQSPSFVADYEENPSRFCSAAWALLGPNGTYRRQMLEAK
jgi:hypothetical protein